jgi:hypothetical protein
MRPVISQGDYPSPCGAPRSLRTCSAGSFRRTRVLGSTKQTRAGRMLHCYIAPRNFRMPQLGIVTFHSSFTREQSCRRSRLATHLSRLLPDWKVDIVDLYYASKQECTNEHDRAGAHDTGLQHGAASVECGEVCHRPEPPTALASLGERYQHWCHGSDEVWKLRYRRRLLGFGKVAQSDPFFPAFRMLIGLTRPPEDSKIRLRSLCRRNAAASCSRRAPCNHA